MIDWFAVLSIIAIVILAGLYVVAGLKAKIAELEKENIDLN